MIGTDGRSSESSSRTQSFKTTLWNVVLEAGKDDSERSRAALARLCRMYWYPLYVFVRRQGYQPQDAQDLVQEFFVRILEKNYFKQADPGKGRFRSFLITALKYFMADEWDRVRCEKRGGSTRILPFEDTDPETRYLDEMSGHLSPEKAFERRWALTLLEQVLAQLKEEYREDGRAELFSELEVFLNGDQTNGARAEVCKRLGMREGTLRVTVHRLRARYREILRWEISKTVVSEQAIDDEIERLFEALS